jgi:hypothetical protein
MKRLAFILLAVSVAVSGYADSWARPSPRAYASPSGKLVLRILPGDGQTGRKALAVIFELSSGAESYTKKKEFPLVNLWSPVDACISDEAEVFTFDDWGMMGIEHVLVSYGADGKKKSEYSLAQLFPAKPLSEISENYRSASSSSIYWRRGRPYINGVHLIIPDALGGSVCITQGVPDYIFKEAR